MISIVINTYFCIHFWTQNQFFTFYSMLGCIWQFLINEHVCVCVNYSYQCCCYSCFYYYQYHYHFLFHNFIIIIINIDIITFVMHFNKCSSSRALIWHTIMTLFTCMHATYHKRQELSYCRGWPTVRELKRLCLHRRCVEYLATGNFYLLA